MRNRPVPVLFVCVIVSISIATRALAQDRPLVPADVTEFITRFGYCLLWTRDVPGFRAAQKEGFTETQRCGEIAQDERAIKDKYASNPEVLKILSGGAVVAWKKPPVQSPVPSPEPKSAELPPDITGFVSRRATCLELSKKPDDQQRPAQNESLVQSLRCDDIPREEQALRERYAGSPDFLAALNASWLKVIQRVPVRPDQ